MRTLLKYNILLIILIGMVGASSTSCEDNDDASGTPVVHYVRVTDPNSSDSLLAGGLLGNMIAIVGENLGNAKQVCFNDQCLFLNSTYITDQTIITTIPSQAPSEVNDLLTIIFRDETVLTHPFTIEIGGPEVVAMKSEYVHTGDVAVIRGNFFFEPMTVTFTGGVQGNIVSIKQSEVEVEVPEGAEPGPITVETNFGEAVSKFWFRDNRYVFGHFEAPTDGWWHGGQYLTPVDEIPAIDNKYIHFTGNIADAGSWLEFYVGPASGGIAEQTRNIPDDAIVNPERYDLKFEMLTLSPIIEGANMKIYIGNNMPDQRGSNWYDYAIVADTQGEWQTFSIPFGDVMKQIRERTSPPLTVNVDPNGYGISFWFHESNAAMPLDFAIDNIRVSPK